MDSTFAKQINTDPDLVIKVLIIGDAGVGKTSLSSRFTNGSFTMQYITTIGVDFKTKMVKFEDRNVKYQVWDTAGQERFRSIAKAYYRGVSGILLTFALTDRVSFENIEKWITTIEENTENDCSKLLVGTKSDCEEERVVSQQEAEDLSSRIGIRYMQTSAKEDIRVSEAFNLLGEDIYRKWKEQQSKKVSNRNNHYVIVSENKQRPKKRCCSD